jgi:membrane fusion protein, multidrug efflux system
MLTLFRKIEKSTSIFSGEFEAGVGHGPLWTILLTSVLFALVGCQRKTETVIPEVRPVRTVTVAMRETGETTVLTGHIEAENEVALAFRISGRMIERLVNVGDQIKPGQIVARLDPQNEVNALRSAEANFSLTRAQLTQARNNFDRQKRLLERRVSSRAEFEHAEEAFQTAQSQVDDAEAQVKIARDRVSYTELDSDVAGAVTARGAESGEVVQAGQMILRIARQDGRDAVFDVPGQLLRSESADAQVKVGLNDDASVTATGRVREIAPQADPVTRLFRVKVGLIDPPAAMRLGSTVTGSVQLDSTPAIVIPASALTEFNGRPAVWVVDPSSLTVSLQNIDVLRFDPGTIVVSHGLETGEIVVTAGVQALHPSQKVRLLASSP